MKLDRHSVVHRHAPLHARRGPGVHIGQQAYLSESIIQDLGGKLVDTLPLSIICLGIVRGISRMSATPQINIGSKTCLQWNVSVSFFIVEQTSCTSVHNKIVLEFVEHGQRLISAWPDGKHGTHIVVAAIKERG